MAAETIVQAQSVSASWRERGNEKYRSVTDRLAPAVRLSRLQDAISFYDRAMSTAVHDHEKSSACKNLAVAYWKMARASMGGGLAGYIISFNFKQALKHFQDAKEYGKGRDPAWHDSLVELCGLCWNTLCERVGQWDYEDRIQELEKMVAFHIDDPTKAREYVEIANHYFHWSVTALGERDYHQCLHLLGKVHFPLNEARRLCQGCPALLQECHLLEDDIFIQHCVATSIQARVKGEELLQALLLEVEDVNMDMVWEVVDWLRQAAQLTRERDLELEAMALSSLGKVYDRVLKMKDRAKHCLMKALELANSMIPRSFTGQDWYDFARSTVEQYQQERRKAEEEEEEKQRSARMHLIKDELEVLQAKEASLSKADFLRFIYNTHPPKNPQHTLSEISSTPEWTELKKLYQKAVVHYHPDKIQEDEHGVKWKTLTAEITKMLTQQYEYYKGC